MEEKNNKDCKCEKECNCNEKDNSVHECNCNNQNDKKKKNNCKKKKTNSDELEKLKNEISIRDERLIRLNAEIQNIKKHANEERDNLIKYEGEKLITSLLEQIDNFERAIKLDDDNLEDELSKFLSGFKMIYSNLVSLLKSYDVKEIEALHKEFDPHFMQAVLTDKNEKYGSNIVTEVLQKGYMYRDKVIRPVMVKVNE